MRVALRTAGELVELSCDSRWLCDVIEEGGAGQLAPPDGSSPDVRVTVEDGAPALDPSGWELLARDAWRRPGQVMVRNACSSGLDLEVTAGEPTLEVVARWHPPVTVRGAAAVLRARSRLLLRAVLMQYPALWWGQRKGRLPLHASVCTVGGPAGPSVLIAGPGGIGKSTLVNAEIAAGGRATCDNLCVSDGRTAWGLAEPRRVPVDEPGAGQGRRMPHGRREAPWADRPDQLTPDYLLVLRRGGGRTTTAEAMPPDDAVRAAQAGTYMAGELRRYWAFAATLSLGTGIGPIHPDLGDVARVLSRALPCVQVTLGESRQPQLDALLPALAAARR